MSYKSGARYSNDTYIMTETTSNGVSAIGEINGEYVEFTGGGDTEICTINVVLIQTENVPYMEVPLKVTMPLPSGNITGSGVDKLHVGENPNIILVEGKAMIIVDSNSLSGITLIGDDNIEIIALGADRLIIITGDGTLTCSYE